MQDLEALSSASPPGILTLRDGVVETGDAAATRLFGGEPGDLAGVSLETLVQEGDRERLRRTLEHAASGGGTVSARVRGVRFDGVAFPLDVRLKRLPEVDGVLGVVQDLSAFRRAVGRTERYARMLEQAQSLAGVGHWEYAPEQQTVKWSKGVRHVHGVSDDYRPTIDEALAFYAPEDRDVVRRTVSRAVETGRGIDYEATIVTTRGERRRVRAIGESVSVGGRVERLIGTFQDVTDLHIADEKANRLAAIVDASDAGIYSTDLEARITAWNHGAQRLFGYSEGEAVGRRVGMLAPPERETEMPAVHDRVIRGENVELESELLRKDGRRIAAALVVGPIRDRSESVIGISVVARDISEQRRQGRSLDSFFQLAADPLCIIDLQGRLVRINPAFERMLGYSSAELKGRDGADFMHPDDVAISRRKLASLVEGRPTPYFLNRFIGRDGAVYWLEWTARADLEQGVVYAVARDVTEQRRVEERRRQSQKLEALGVLSSGIAHDFNNVLAAVRGHAELARSAIETSPGDTPRIGEALDEIMRAADRASGVVRRILSFSRREANQESLVEIGRVFGEAAGMMRSLIPATIELRFNIDSNAGFVHGERSEIEQILINLCTNSLQAMAGRPGWIAVELRRAVDGGKAGVEVAVRDNAGGVRPEHEERVFDPFFTTKGVDEGVGMGLAVVHGIVTAHGGRVWLENRPGVGAAFRVWLPAASATPAAEAAATGLAESSIDAKASGIALLVEDEPAVRSLVQRALEREGYTVVSCGDPDLALELGAEERFDVVITDLTMPQMSGLQLAGRLRDLQSRAAIVLMTGADRPPTSSELAAAGVRRVLQKPFRLDDLRQAVSEALQEPT